MDDFPSGRASFDPPAEAAERVWRQVADLLRDERERIAGRDVSAPVDVAGLRAAIGAYDFARPVAPREAVGAVAELLRAATVHTTHPRYFGLFNPTPTLMGVVGETLAAAFNPQLAAWSHAPAAAEIEAHLLRFLGGRLGYPRRPAPPAPGRSTRCTASPASARTTASACTWTPPTVAPRPCRTGCGPRWTASAAPTRSRWTRTSG